MTSNIKSVTLFIEGMTCINCENRIERKLSATEGIISVEISYVEGVAVLSYDEDIINLNQIENLIGELGYQAGEMPTKKDKKSNSNITNIVGVMILLVALYMIVNYLSVKGLWNAFPVAKEGMGYGMLLAIGVLTSLHCVAMCGGICLSQCVNKNQGKGMVGENNATWKPSLLYNMGRVVSYTVIGGIVGGLGSVVSFSGTLRGTVQIIAGIFMVIMGLNMLGIFPWLKKWNIRLPKNLVNKIYARNTSNQPFVIGLFNGLMPCGPLQAMQLYALSTGSPFKGALAMFLFSIGTVPLMFGFGAISTFLNKKFTKKMLTVSAALIVILGVVMFQNGTSLSGMVLPSGKSQAVASTTNTNVAVVEDGVQTITTTLSSGSYEAITVQKGIPVKWTILADESSINGCNGTMVIPEYNIEYQLKAGENLIEFTPEESKTIPYSCWMGMIRSQISVVDDISTTNTDNSSSSDTSDNSGSIGGTSTTGGCCGVNN